MAGQTLGACPGLINARALQIAWPVRANVTGARPRPYSASRWSDFAHSLVNSSGFGSIPA